jgi:hypothetical protein
MCDLRVVTKADRSSEFGVGSPDRNGNPEPKVGGSGQRS